MDKIDGLIKMLRKLESVSTYRHWISKPIIEYVKKFPKSVLESVWCDTVKAKYDKKPDLADSGTWCTYDECVNVKFSFNKQEQCVLGDIVIYDGHLLDGARNEARVKAKVLLSCEFLLHLEDVINDAMVNLADWEYEKMLEDKKHIWMRKYIERVKND